MHRIWLALVALLLIANSPRDQALALMDQGDEAAAFAIIDAAAEQGDAETIAFLAWFYDNGRHVEQDRARAAALYRAAATKGDWYAQWRLGVMIDDGTTEGTLQEAVELFRQSAAQGSSNAMTSLAVMYAAARGVAQDYSETRRYYEMAARAGAPDALQGLGVLYMNGEGVAQSKVEAMAYWLVSLSQGSETASGMYQGHTSSLNDAELHAVFKRANEISADYGYEARFVPWAGTEAN